MKTKLVISLMLVCAEAVIARDADYAAVRIAAEAQAKGRHTGHCLLHDRDMTRKTVPVVFGFNSTAKEDAVPGDTRVRYFPHAAEFSVSATLREKDAPTTAKVFVCPDCQEAEKKWKEDHSK